MMLEEGSIREAVAEWPWCREGWWGKTLATVEVVLADADAVVVTELLDEATPGRRAADRGRVACGVRSSSRAQDPRPSQGRIRA